MSAELKFVPPLYLREILVQIVDSAEVHVEIGVRVVVHPETGVGYAREAFPIKRVGKPQFGGDIFIRGDGGYLPMIALHAEDRLAEEGW